MFPYSLPPLCLGMLCDQRVDMTDKESLASWYFNLPHCCRSQSFCRPLLSHAQDSRDLLPGARLSGTLEACFRTPCTNIQCENNFARAQSAKLATRGKSDHSSQLCGKHVLAEMKATHLKDARRKAAHAYFPRDGADRSEEVEPIQDIQHSDSSEPVCPPDVETSNSNFNFQLL